MARITEDYVSFEIAKLLKEKGFEGYSILTTYDENAAKAYIKELREKHLPFSSDDPKLKEFHYTMPTIQMAMKWLRKVHNLCIVPLPVVTDDDGEGGCLWKYTISMKLKVLFDSENLYESPEIALDDAIKCCLENLI